MEVFYNGVWGTICQNNWNIDSAIVVCKELGYVRASSFNDYSTYGPSNGRVGGEIASAHIRIQYVHA